MQAAQADLAAVADGLAREFPDFNKGRTVTLEPLHDTMIGSDLKTTSMLFLGVVGFVLLDLLRERRQPVAGAGDRAIARAGRALGTRCGPPANHPSTAYRERRAVDHWRRTRESASAPRFCKWRRCSIPEGLLPATVTLTFDLRVVAFCALAALVVGIVFGIAPAFQATAVAPSEAMGADNRTTTGSGGRLRSLLVVGEVATAVLLLFGAGLLLRTLMAVQSFDRGYRAGKRVDDAGRSAEQRLSTAGEAAAVLRPG